MNSKSGIYRIYWNNCSYYYIGQSVDVYKRFSKHKRLLKKGIHENSRLQNVFNKYGLPEMEVIIYCKVNMLTPLEQSVLNISFGKEDCCNLVPLANSTKGYKHTEECKKRIGELSKKKIFTEEYREKLRKRKPNITMLGKKHSPEARLKMSIAHKGVPKTEEWKRKISESNKKTKNLRSCLGLTK